MSGVATLRVAVEEMPIGNFSMVMATGICSISAFLLGLTPAALALFAVNVVAYPCLCALTVLRLAWQPRRVLREITDHALGPTSFTVVAATCVLGSQFVVLFGSYRAAAALWFLALALWLVLNYAVFTGLTVTEEKPTLAEGISGAWLLAVVAVQSIALLGAQLADFFGTLQLSYRLMANFMAFSMWLWGGMLYIWLISLIFYRYTFFRFSPEDLTPPYWINMGAMAISSLTGAILIINAPHAPFLHSTLPFIKGFSVFYWATGTWWIPMLAILAVWRHAWKRVRFEYHYLYWGAVFPLGMYAAATFRLSQALEMSFLMMVPRLFFCAALAAWLAAFAGLSRRVAGHLAVVLAPREVCGL